jgi:dethiobiotin synthase
MSTPLPARLFVTGTDTGVGKTVVSALLLAGRGGRYWKPVQSGAEEDSDSQTVAELSGRGPGCLLPEAYRLRAPLSPHRAALLDGVRIDLARLALPPLPAGEPLVVEGAGGALVPLAPGLLMTDLMAALGLPVLVVARSGLGTINHTLLTVEALRARGLAVAGVVLCGPRDAADGHNRQAIEEYGQVRVVGELEPLAELTPAALRAAWAHHFPGC